MADTRKTYLLREDEFGSVRIAEELITTIAALTATEVEGVASLAGNITHEAVAKASVRSLAQGIRTEVKESSVRFDLSLNIDYGRNLMDVSREVQERVKNAVETMTGFAVEEVRVKIEDVDLPLSE